MSNNTKELWFVFSGQRLLVTDQTLIPNANHDFIKTAVFKRQFALDHSGLSPMAAELAADALLPADLQLIDLKKLYLLLPADIIALAGKARQLIEWDKAHQFCGECGTATTTLSHEHSRQCTNPTCARIFYPRIAPVIIVAVERGDEILLARSPHFPPQIYSVLAGFVEAGESVEECIHREVYEETAIKIKNLRYFSSQSWPFPGSLMLGFQADYASGDIVCAPNEIEDAQFFNADALPKTPPGRANISKWLIEDFCRRRDKKE